MCDPENFQKTTCTICHTKIMNNEVAYRSSVSKASVCQRCDFKYPRWELELMIGLFLAYGGYFGKYRSLYKSVEEVCLESVDHLEKLGKEVRFEEIDIKILHTMLLHGYTQKDYIAYLDSN
ncbi:MAG: hypothetical protein EU548_10240 [Promethearchaeota archaeon]|nr:MAG: hypothetical protein EU548_10240 [Candidatus Lokiarchaeota archaeon]